MSRRWRRKLRRSELPASKDGEKNPWLTDDGQLKPGIIRYGETAEWPEPPLVMIDRARLRPQIEIEIFLRVKGRLPMKKGDKLTPEMCLEFIEKFMNHPEHGRYIGDAFEILAELRNNAS